MLIRTSVVLSKAVYNHFNVLYNPMSLNAVEGTVELF